MICRQGQNHMGANSLQRRREMTKKEDTPKIQNTLIFMHNPLKNSSVKVRVKNLMAYKIHNFAPEL
jgi:hypothetical protein